MKKLILVIVLGLTNIAHGQSKKEFSPEYKANLQKEIQRRHEEIRRRNASQAEALRLVTQGLNMLSRPAEPWRMPYYRPVPIPRRVMTIPYRIR